MIITFSSLVVGIAALSTPVLCGSRAWEGRLSLRLLEKRSLDPIPVDAAGYAIRTVATFNNASDRGLSKRWLAVSPGQGMQPTRLWPDKTISYCFDSVESRDAIFDPLELAIQSWHAAGLSRMVYNYLEVAEPGTACTNNPQRDKILVISHNRNGYLATSLAMPPIDAEDPNDRGPTMQLSVDATIGQLNIVANFAHEVGHAWGLLHEHQNPKFWTAPYYMEASPDFAGTVFGTHFDCSALRDYHLVIQRIEDAFREEDNALAQANQVKRDVCTRQSAASFWKFSAADWLPVPANYRHHKDIPHLNADDSHVDWDSIMLYPSGAGGVGSARAPTGPDENPDAYDQRLPVLRRNSDGEKIRTNAVPSAGDVAGIRALYESVNARENEGGRFVLPNDKKHSRWPEFMKDFSLRKNKNCER
ncbi:hypothetical protein N658DRAFT_480834 [Parathielavia hyrcaniae]|uniref:Uncharacterized protein n=1 Tax=Parathielavia hyrcaniae TaxID=113614 RepID=A0AAN6PVW9_9PEZI|nr:hypothetical protein N658DRAFT_480834 [Parathielavia hyrcaniae]